MNNITFSLHSLNKDQYKKLQKLKLSDTKISEFINTTTKNIEELNNSKIEVDINILFISSSVTAGVIEFAVEQGINVNIFGSIYNLKRTQNDIFAFLSKLRVLPKKIIDFKNSSRVEYVFEYKNIELTVKNLEPFFLQSLCNDCSFKNKNKCYEFFYGLRVVQKNGILYVKPCIHKNELYSIDNFTNSLIAKELLKINKMESKLKLKKEIFNYCKLQLEEKNKFLEKEIKETQHQANQFKGAME